MWHFKYPYTNFHEINLDWILETVKSNTDRIAENELKIKLIGGDDPLNSLHPVGSIFISTENTSPASLFGGTWEQIRGRFLLASGSPDANTYNLFGNITGGWQASLGSTGGQDYHTLTIEEMPSHTHESQYVKPESGYMAAGMMGSTEANWWSVDYIRATGGGQKHNNMPPYLAVYMWKRVS